MRPSLLREPAENASVASLGSVHWWRPGEATVARSSSSKPWQRGWRLRGRVWWFDTVVRPVGEDPYWRGLDNAGGAQKRSERTELDLVLNRVRNYAEEPKK